MSDKLTCRFRQGFVCRNLPEFGGRATPARRIERLKGGAPTLAPRPLPASSRHGTRADQPRQVRSLLGSRCREHVPACDKSSFVSECETACFAQGLPNAVKHLNDEELDRLLAVTLAEAKQRGRQTTSTYEPSLNRKVEAAGSLTRGQLNAVRAAFKAGITPARIARQFGLSQSDVRTALKSDKRE